MRYVRALARRAVPLVHPATGGGGEVMARPSALLDTRIIYCGDCLDQLRKLPVQCIDLIYIDPPFNSNRNYEVFWGETKEKRAFDDRHASTQAYIEFMRPRCVELARVLKATGSFYYHCDDHASHYVKVMLDQIMGENNFQNEIIWKRTTARSDAKRWNQLHDTLLVYSGGGDPTWNPQYEEYSDDYLSTKYRYQETDGRRYRLGDITSPNPRPNMMYEWKGFKSPPKGWRYSRETMTELDAGGRIWYPSDKAKRPQIKRYLDEMQGILMGSVWTDIDPLNSQALERLGYPTQKPLPLLERIISASSNENDIVLDAFCGCGTALVAAQNLKRQWIGIDISPTACRVMAKRLKKDCKLPENEKLWGAGRGFVVRDLPWTEQQLRTIPHFEFENWAVIALAGTPNKAQVGDMGIDGRIFPVSSLDSKRDADAARERDAGAGQLAFMDQWYPVQVKQKDKAGRPDIDAFEAVMMRENRDRGYFVSFDYSSDAVKEADAFYRRTKKLIKLVTVKDILEEQLSRIL
jgi:site-specific DNA-methyltransferase (adenine-specific)